MAYTPEQLRFAAVSRCRCGAGLAYPRDMNLRGYWECSAILLGEATPSMDHDGPYPFMFWSILSEEQKARTGGATTRPGGPIDAERLQDAPGERDVQNAGYPDALLANPKAR